jgi:hypothetical protein
MFTIVYRTFFLYLILSFTRVIYRPGGRAFRAGSRLLDSLGQEEKRDSEKSNGLVQSNPCAEWIQKVFSAASE